jgi:MFS family permease
MSGQPPSAPTGGGRPRPRARSRLLRAVGGKFGYLLGALIALILSSPLIDQSWFWYMAYLLFAIAVLVASVHAVRPGRSWLVIGLIVALVDFATGRLAVIRGADWLVFLQVILWISTLIFVTITLFEAIFDSDVVGVETLQAALCIYLLLGLIWVYFFVLIDMLAPGSFLSKEGTHVNWWDDRSRRFGFMRLFVFSYSTLSGSGYGGVSPAGGFAELTASLEAIIANIYMAVVIARLVGIQSAQPSAGSAESRPPCSDSSPSQHVAPESTE